MRRGFRRRKARPLWFPPIGVTFTAAETLTTVGYTTFSLNIAGSGAINTLELPVTFDFGQEAILADAAAGQIRTLADIMGSAWRLRRAFGNIFAAFHINNTGNSDPDQTSYPSCIFTAGLMVRKVDQFGVPTTNTSPLERDDYDDPWIWRRGWILGQDAKDWRDSQFGGQTNTITARSLSQLGPNGTNEANAFAKFPQTTAHYMGLHSGAFFDQKTNRIIGPEDRLILHFAVKGNPIVPSDPERSDNAQVIGIFDIRYVGFLARSSNRRNASR